MEKIGKCKICTINLYKEANNMPAKMPCGIMSCPYEKDRKILEKQINLQLKNLLQYQ